MGEKIEKLGNNQPVRPANFKPLKTPSARELMAEYSDGLMKRADAAMEKAAAVNAAGKYKPNWDSLDAHPLPEWFEDAKFGMFVDWGLYSIGAYAPSGYPDWYLNRMMGDTKAYHDKYWGQDFRQDDFIPLFTAKDFDAEHLADVAVAAGMKYIIPFLKHHDGFSLWDSSFTLRDSVDMGPRRDIAGEWADACRKRKLKFGFYYSIDDWFYPVIGENGDLTVRAWAPFSAPTDWIRNEADWDRRMLAGKIPVRDFYNQYINPTAIEFFDKYDPDIFWGDADWMDDWKVRNSLSFLAYFYNKAEGRKEVASNDRIGCCRLVPAAGQKPEADVHGDFKCTEASYRPGIAKSRGIREPWEENHGLSHSFGYNWRETDKDVRSARELLFMLIDIVADGGNLLLITNLTPSGKLDPLMAARLKEVGDWMKVNGEAIFATRRWIAYNEGNDVRFTRSKDGRFVYAIFLKWPGAEFWSRLLAPAEGSKVTMLGDDCPLKWTRRDGSLTVDLPGHLQAENQRPCKHAWVLKIEVAPGVAIGSSKAFVVEGSSLDVELLPQGLIDEIHYTIDGSAPTRQSPLYTKPLEISSECSLKAQAFRSGTPVGEMVTRDFKVLVNARAVKPEVFLDDLEPVSIERGWSRGNQSWKRHSCTGGKLLIKGLTYDRGIGLHADAEAVFKIKPEYERFVAQFGVDDVGREGTVRVSVYADEQLLGVTPVLRCGQEPWTVDLLIPTGVDGKRASQLRIVVDQAGDGIKHDHTDIVNAGFVCAGVRVAKGSRQKSGE